jgi:hypothetical protein
MFRTLSITAVGAALCAALAMPAAAETSIKVDVAGLPAPQAHARIVQAAAAACRTELKDTSTFDHYYWFPECVDEAVTQANVQLKAMAARAEHPVVAGR